MRQKPLVKVRQRPGRNEPCPCRSGIKFKKCHGQQATILPQAARKAARTLRVCRANTDTHAPGAKQEVALSMFRANLSHALIWAYLETGLFVTAGTRESHSASDLATWDGALARYAQLPEASRRIFVIDQSNQEDIVGG